MSEDKNLPAWFESWWLDEAVEEAKRGLEEGGIPIGSVLVDPSVRDGDRLVKTFLDAQNFDYLYFDHHTI